MRKSTATRFLALIALLAAGCGPAAAPAARVSSPSPTAAAVATPTAGATSNPTSAPGSCDASHRCLALVTLRGSNQVVVRDITDISHPRTIGTIGPLASFLGVGPSLEGARGQFVNSTDVAYLTGNSDDSYGLPTSLVRAPFSGSPQTTLVAGTQAVVLFTSSADGQTMVYLRAGEFPAVELHERRAGADRVLATLPTFIGVGGCEVAPCPGPFQNPADNWDFRLDFSPDGQYISVVGNAVGSHLRVWTADGRLVTARDDLETMSVWSGARLYFRDSKGVEVWHDGAISTFLSGIAWIRPKASPDGRHILYEARDTNAVARVFIVDTGSGQVTQLGGIGRSEPAFLTNRYVWYQSDPACVAARSCSPAFPGVATGTTYVYDLVDNTEATSVVTSVLDVWPHAA
jgi:hypothetical protein